MRPEHIAGLEKALLHSGGTHSLRDVADQITQGDAQLWAEESAVLVTQIVETPKMRILHFWLAAGEMDEVITLTEKVIKWGSKNGCERATLTGRKGWERALASTDWEPELVLMGRNITDGQGQEATDHTDIRTGSSEPGVR